MTESREIDVENLGARTVASPLELSTTKGDGIADYVPDDARVAADIECRSGEPLVTRFFEKAGPRERIFFDPKTTRAAIVTCGGLCPGINNVVRAIVLELHHKYGVHEVLGYRYGFEGIVSADLPPIRLDPDAVRNVHGYGGSFLGLSRGKQSPVAMVDALVRDRVDILFTIGGDGTLRGAHVIAEEAKKRGLKLAIVGVPKTIDNDIAFVDKTFGFETAVEVARLAIDAAHTEAIGARNGVSIVKLMGRDSGFIAATATLASAEVNYCLLPEVPFALHGEHGLLASLEKRLALRSHAVVVIAEGCAASLAGADESDGLRDASGNVRYASGGFDVGPVLRDAIIGHFQARNLPINVKYIDPSYMVRSVRANATDAVFCDSLARNAVHAAMAGKTDLVLGRLHRVFIHVPIGLATSEKKRVDPDGQLWLAVTETTGQPRFV